MHDELDLPEQTLTHWNLQVVADAHRQTVGECDFTFTGRFGTDLQVLLPEQRFSRQEITQEAILDYNRSAQESFSMRHLQLSEDSPENVVALLRPLFAGRRPLIATLLRDSSGGVCGVGAVTGGIEDTFFLRRGGVALECGEYAFTGRYGAILRRAEGLTLVVLDGEMLRLGGIRLAVRGVSVSLQIGADGSCSLCAEGRGSVEITGLSRPVRLNVAGEKYKLRLEM